MPQSKSGGFHRLSRADIAETALIVGLAALVLIKGGAAVGGISLGLGGMMAAVVSVIVH